MKDHEVNIVGCDCAICKRARKVERKFIKGRKETQILYNLGYKIIADRMAEIKKEQK
jgi:hypothetical protein